MQSRRNIIFGSVDIYIAFDSIEVDFDLSLLGPSQATSVKSNLSRLFARMYRGRAVLGWSTWQGLPATLSVHLCLAGHVFQFLVDSCQESGSIVQTISMLIKPDIDRVEEGGTSCGSIERFVGFLTRRQKLTDLLETPSNSFHFLFDGFASLDPVVPFVKVYRETGVVNSDTGLAYACTTSSAHHRFFERRRPLTHHCTLHWRQVGFPSNPLGHRTYRAGS